MRTLSGYKFDECNDNGSIPWYDTNAYSPNKSLQEKMGVISKAYSELSKSQLDYVKFYMNNHKQIPMVERHSYTKVYGCLLLYTVIFKNRSGGNRNGLSNIPKNDTPIQLILYHLRSSLARERRFSGCYFCTHF